MSNNKENKVSLDQLVEALESDVKAFKDEKVLTQILHIHMHRAYTLGFKDNTPYKAAYRN